MHNDDMSEADVARAAVERYADSIAQLVNERMQRLIQVMVDQGLLNYPQATWIWDGPEPLTVKYLPGRGWV